MKDKIPFKNTHFHSGIHFWMLESLNEKAIPYIDALNSKLNNEQRSWLANAMILQELWAATKYSKPSNN